MDSGGKITTWISKLCCGFDTSCTEAKDMLPQQPVGHVRDQFLTAGENLKLFYPDLTKDVFPMFSRDSNGPTSAKQEENTGSSPDSKSTISTHESQERESEAVKSFSLGGDSLSKGLTPGEIENVALIKLAASGQSSLGGSFDNMDDISSSKISPEIQEYKSPSSEAIQYDAPAKLSASFKSLAACNCAGIDDISKSEFSAEIQEYKSPTSGATGFDALTKFSASLQPLCDNRDDISNILDSEFSTEIEDCEAPDDESSGAIHSIHKDALLLGRELQDELIKLGFLASDSGSVQSVEVDSSEETEEDDNITESECSTEEAHKATDTSSVSPISISTRTSSSDCASSENNLQAQLLELGFCETPFDLGLDSAAQKGVSGYVRDPTLRCNNSIDPYYDSDSDISDYSSSGETTDSDTGVTQPNEEQKIIDIEETDEPPLLDMKFVEERLCETDSQGNPDAEANEEKAEASQDKEWERLDEDFESSDWELV